MSEELHRIKQLVGEQEEYIVSLRRHFHSHPEPSWEEFETTKKIAEELRAMGCENVRVGFGGIASGVTAEISGNGPGKCVALRADIDALRLDDEKDVPYRSQRKGAAHACGHDGHAAMLLGAARVLIQCKDRFQGKARLIFQLAEETVLRSGAKQMIADGALEGVDAIFAFHLFSTIPSGIVHYNRGPFMAGSDRFEIVIKGRGGHGSMPHYAVDPTVATAAAIMAWQTIVSREVSPRETAVISVGDIATSSHISNIIPDRVSLAGTVRGFSGDVMKTIEEAFLRTTRNTAAAYRCDADVQYVKGYLPTINDGKMAEVVRDAAVELLGEAGVVESEPMMGSEDFSFYLQKIPGAYFGLGSSRGDESTSYPHHSPKFDLDESVFTTGAALHVLCALRFLEG